MTSFPPNPDVVDVALTPDQCADLDRLRRTIPGRETRDAYLDRSHPRPGLRYADVPRSFAATTRARGWSLEYLERPADLEPGESVPDHWFVAQRGGRAGIALAAARLRPYFPLTAAAITELCTDLRVARFAGPGHPEPRVGLFYLQRSITEGRPLAMVGLPPNPHPRAVPAFWSMVPSSLRDFAADVHDGFVDFPTFDAGPRPVADLVSLTDHAADVGLFDDTTTVYAHDRDHVAVPLDTVPRPVELCVVAATGAQVAYLFEITDPLADAWSFGESTLIAARAPIADLLDDVMSARLARSCRHPEDPPGHQLPPEPIPAPADPVAEDRFLSHVSTELDKRFQTLAARGQCDPTDAAWGIARQQLRDKGYLVHQPAAPHPEGENRLVDPIAMTVRYVPNDLLLRAVDELPPAGEESVRPA